MNHELQLDMDYFVLSPFDVHEIYTIKYSHIYTFRLRLVRVKAFPENRYFPEMLFSGKENVFMCLGAFQKNFRKIFSDVWLYS